VIDAGAGGSDARLRRLEAVTDAGLSQLGAEDQVEQLLDRTRELLDVDTAAILLLDPLARQLVATAAKGLEEEVRRGVRISVGRGFAGRIARERRSVVLDEVTSENVVNPILLETGLRSMLGVPMFAAGDVIGVMHVGSLTRRKFSEEDVQLLQLIADRASLACQVRSSSLDRAAALALQRSLLPTRLPEAPGLDLAARYVPGHTSGVGGDWYDVFPLPSGSLGVVIGDVSGHGLQAAVVMGRLRSALRAYTLICNDPAEALTLLDRKIHYFEAGRLATVVYALISPDRRSVECSIAGHLLPVLAAPDHPADLVDLPVDLPLGTGQFTPARRSTKFAFPAGAVLVCYTDGLVERRGELIDEGIDRLCAVVEPDSAETVCAKIMAGLGEEQPTDDIALLTIATNPVAPA
jgi:sigma-B regulation protein RsbU (phosphoserine phosphatase)